MRKGSSWIFKDRVFMTLLCLRGWIPYKTCLHFYKWHISELVKENIYIALTSKLFLEIMSIHIGKWKLWIPKFLRSVNDWFTNMASSKSGLIEMEICITELITQIK